jgi:tetratricopeptide (TPR) repeat protein
MNPTAFVIHLLLLIQASPDPVLTTDQAIAEFQEKVKNNPKSPLLHTLLGQMYVRKARDSGDFSNYDRAEASLRRALELDKTSVSAQVTLAQVLSANHHFHDALRLAREVYQKNPGEHGILLMIGDAHLELGNYADAEKAYRDLQRKEPAAYLESRLARLAELKGQTAEALRRMQKAKEEEGPAALSPEGRAWYDARLAEIHFEAGHLEDAAKHYQAALKIAPKSYVALAGLGRVRAAQGKIDEALDLYGQAIVIAANLPQLAELGDLYAHAGKDFLARLNYDKLEKTARDQPAYHRELALFSCDHNRNLPQALELAQKELKVRKDLYTYDALAWALCKNGRFQEAETAMTEALKLGTADARLFYHAGMIYRGLGDKEKARTYLKRALALNPHFTLRGAEEARRTLETLEGKR